MRINHDQFGFQAQTSDLPPGSSVSHPGLSLDYDRFYGLSNPDLSHKNQSNAHFNDLSHHGSNNVLNTYEQSSHQTYDINDESFEINESIDDIIASLDESARKDAENQQRPRKHANTRYRYRKENFGTIEEQERIMDQWDMLSPEVCNDPIQLAEATLSMDLEGITPRTITSMMVKLLMDCEAEDSFVKEFKRRRHIIGKTKTASYNLSSRRPAECSKEYSERALKLIGRKKKDNIPLDDSIVDLEKVTRDIHKRYTLDKEKPLYDAILFYLLHHRKDDIAAAQFRRLRSDHKKANLH